MTDVHLGVVNPVARRDDFDRLPKPVQASIIELLRTCERERLSVRCEAIGRNDVYVVVGRGLSSARHWLMVFGAIPPNAS